MGTLLDEILKDPSKISTAVLAILAVYAFMFGKVVPRWSYDATVAQCQEFKKERDEFKAMALQNVSMTDRALDLAQKKGSS